MLERGVETCDEPLEASQFYHLHCDVWNESQHAVDARHPYLGMSLQQYLVRTLPTVLDHTSSRNLIPTKEFVEPTMIIGWCDRPIYYNALLEFLALLNNLRLPPSSPLTCPADTARAFLLPLLVASATAASIKQTNNTSTTNDEITVSSTPEQTPGSILVDTFNSTTVNALGLYHGVSGDVKFEDFQETDGGKYLKVSTGDLDGKINRSERAIY